MKLVNQLSKNRLACAVATAMLGMVTCTLIAAEPAPAMEKCYGIAKAGKNDCGTPGGNACAAQDTRNGDPKAWIFVPKGTCDKIVGGSTTAG